MPNEGKIPENMPPDPEFVFVFEFPPIKLVSPDKGELDPEFELDPPKALVNWLKIPPPLLPLLPLALLNRSPMPPNIPPPLLEDPPNNEEAF